MVVHVGGQLPAIGVKQPVDLVMVHGVNTLFLPFGYLRGLVHHLPVFRRCAAGPVIGKADCFLCAAGRRFVDCIIGRGGCFAVPSGGNFRGFLRWGRHFHSIGNRGFGLFLHQLGERKLLIAALWYFLRLRGRFHGVRSRGLDLLLYRLGRRTRLVVIGGVFLHDHSGSGGLLPYFLPYLFLIGPQLRVNKILFLWGLRQLISATV